MQHLAHQIGQHHANQKAHQRRDGQRLRADVIKTARKITPRPGLRRARQAQRVQKQLAHNLNEAVHLCQRAFHALAQAVKALREAGMPASGGRQGELVCHTLQQCALRLAGVQRGGPLAAPAVPQHANQ